MTRTIVLKTLRWWLYLAFLWQVFSCSSLKPMAAYDEPTDAGFVTVQRQVVLMLVRLRREIGTPASAYPRYSAQYETLHVDLYTLRLRASAINNNQIVLQQVEGLTRMVAGFESLHRIGFKQVAELRPVETNFMIAFTAINKLQYALKRGKSPPTTSK